MLGNAFQHFLTRADQEALLARVRDHVPPEGRFLFCTRNPSPHHLQQARSAEPQQYTLPDGRQQVSTEQQAYDPLSQIQYYTWHEQWLYPDERREEKTTRTALRYVYPQEMEALLFYNGFQIDARHRRLAAGTADRHESPDDLCLPETGLALGSCACHAV